MAIFDLSTDLIESQLQAIEKAVENIRLLMSKGVNADTDFTEDTSHVRRVEAFRRKYMAQVLFIADTAQVMASRTILPSNLYDPNSQ